MLTYDQVNNLFDKVMILFKMASNQTEFCHQNFMSAKSK